MPKKNSVPFGWRSLQAVGTRMQGTRFIAFKVPLKGTINQRLTPNQKFTPKDLVTEIRLQGEELGLVVDLTNTNRYYEVKDLPKGVSYQKLPTAGLEVPDDDAILQFKKIVRKFLRQNQHNDKLVGVHCTTGLSRTGYLICRYLVDVDGWNPDVAMKAFSESRGLAMDGRVYVADLKIGKKRSNEGIDDCDPDEEVGPATLPQHDDPPRAEWSEGPFHGTQHWDDLKEQRDLEDGQFMSRGHGERVNPFQDDRFQHDLKQKMIMEGYEVLDRPDHRQRSIHGNLSNEDQQEPRAKRRFEDEDFHRLSQRSEPFPEERYGLEAGRNRDFYDSQQGPRAPHDGVSYDIKGLKHLEDNSFHNSRPEQRPRPFPSEYRDFRAESSRDVFDAPPGQRPRPQGHQSHDDFKVQMQFEGNDFRNSRPGRIRPLEGESRDFPAERAREVLDNMPGQRPKPFTMHDLQAGRQTLGRESRNFNVDAQTEDYEFPNVVPGQRPGRFNAPQGRNFDETMQIEDDFSKRGYQQRPQPYVSQSPSSGFQNDGAMEGRTFSDRDLGQRPFHGPQTRDSETELQMGKYDISNNENRQRMRLPISRSPHYKVEHEMEGTDFHNSVPGRRPRPFRDITSHGLKPEFKMEEGGFSNSGLGQRQRSFNENQSHDLEVEMKDRGMNRPGPRPFHGQPQSSFSSEQLSESGPSYPDSSKRMRLSDELNQGDHRFAPYASHIQPPPLSMGQIENPRPYERSTLDRPVDSTLSSNSSATFDYNYGMAEKQKFAPEGNFRERPGLPRRSRFN